MRILHNNLIRLFNTVTNPALTTVDSHPFENLYSQRIAERYRINTRQTKEISLDFGSTKYKISCLLFSYTTAYEMDVTFLDDKNKALKTYSFTLADNINTISPDNVRTTIIYTPNDMDEVSEVTFKFKKWVGDVLDIGSIYLGRYIQMPPFDSKPKIGSRYTGAVSTSPDGLIFPRQGVSLRTFSCNFGGIKTEKYDEIKALKLITQSDSPMWVDFYPERHDIFPPVFVRNTNRFTVEKTEDGIFFDKLRLKLEECK